MDNSGIKGKARRMKIFGFSILSGAAALLCLGPGEALAAAAEKAICAVEQTIACAPFEKCERSLPSAVNLPVLLKIDRAAGVILSRTQTGVERSSKIGSESGDDAHHVMQGVEGGEPWSMRVDLKTGRFTLANVQPDAGYVAFGVCSAKILN